MTSHFRLRVGDERVGGLPDRLWFGRPSLALGLRGWRFRLLHRQPLGQRITCIPFHPANSVRALAADGRLKQRSDRAANAHMSSFNRVPLASPIIVLTARPLGRASAPYSRVTERGGPM